MQMGKELYYNILIRIDAINTIIKSKEEAQFLLEVENELKPVFNKYGINLREIFLTETPEEELHERGKQ